MNSSDFLEMERMYAEWSKMDNTAKLTWLTKEKIRFNGLASQMAQYVSANGGFMNNAERANARKLLDMLNSVDAEGTKGLNDLRNDAFRELAKEVLKHFCMIQLNPRYEAMQIHDIDANNSSRARSARLLVALLCIELP